MKIIRDRRGVILGRIEQQASVGKLVARNAQGRLVGTFDPREHMTRDSRGLIVARGDILAALLVR
ncbi:hypothetical protein [Methylobacterium mesophilicum]|uniref:hypothetical protein n=1 Tax=Methylobacterium mesophilicum TaxID=39956 RepID=UPI0003A33DC9|nr:hypothetical protein [Methylobacterium mesophilicum]